MSYSPLSVIASVGLLKNQGMSLDYITSVVTNYNDNPLPGLLSDAVTLAVVIDTELGNTVNASAVSSIGSDILPGLIGSMPEGVNLPSGNLADAALTQAQAIFPNGDISSFVQNFGKSSGAAGMCNDLFKAANVLAGKSWEEFGGGIAKISDVATAGFGNLSLVSGVGLKELGAQLTKLGATESLPDLAALQEKLGNPVNLAKKIIDQGIGGVGAINDKLKQAGLPIDDPAALDLYATNTFAVREVTRVLGTVTNPSDLEKIKISLDVAPDVQIATVTDLLDPVKALPGLNNFLNTDVFTNITKVLSGLPGAENLPDVKTIGEMLQSIEDTPDASALDAEPNFIDDEAIEDLRDELPLFEDDEEGPTTADLIGVVSGGKVADLLVQATNSNQRLVVTSEYAEIESLLTDLVAALTLTDPNYPEDYTTNFLPDVGSREEYTILDYKEEIEAAMEALAFSGNAELEELCEPLSAGFTLTAKRLSNQIESLSRMDIDLTQVQPGNKMSLISFGRSLGDLAKQPGNEDLLTKLCGNDAVGQALKVHVVEKKNLEVLQKFGINPPNLFKF